MLSGYFLVFPWHFSIFKWKAATISPYKCISFKFDDKVLSKKYLLSIEIPKETLLVIGLMPETKTVNDWE